jgi:choline dehydrogenase-like flavoprotein
VSYKGFAYDVIVIGSGFGGSVTALRATEKGYRVGVPELGLPLARELWSCRSHDCNRIDG